MFNPYVKAVIAMLLAVAATLGTAWDDSLLTTTEIVTAVAAGFIAFTGVWAFKNPQVKAGIAAVVAGLASLGLALEDDKLSAQEITTIIVATLTALMVVYKTPNEPTPQEQISAVNVPAKT